jgi:hypothetical protein
MVAVVNNFSDGGLRRSPYSSNLTPLVLRSILLLQLFSTAQDNYILCFFLSYETR